MQDVYNNTSLLLIFIHVHEKIAGKLIEAGADYSIVKVDGKSVLELATQQDSLPLLTALTARRVDLKT